MTRVRVEVGDCENDAAVRCSRSRSSSGGISTSSRSSTVETRYSMHMLLDQTHYSTSHVRKQTVGLSTKWCLIVRVRNTVLDSEGTKHGA